MLKIRPVEDAPGLYEILNENGHSYLDMDSVRCKLGKQIKRELKNTLVLVCQALKIQGIRCLSDFVEEGLLKKIDRNTRAARHHLWEVRNPAHGGRIFFIMDDKGQIIVSAVDKYSKDSKAQEKAINRGLNRWEEFLSKS